MNHDAARQKSDNRLWHYTRYNKRTGTYPIGPCAESCPGHHSAEEARNHYKQGLLESAYFQADLGEDAPRNIEMCEFDGCMKLTSGYGEVGYRHYALCEDHRNSTALGTLFDVGESWSS